jgi:hypothetical protein
MNKIEELGFDKIDWYKENDYIFENGIKYVSYDGSYIDEQGKEIEVIDGKLTVEFTMQRAIKELNELFKDCNSFEDVVNVIDNYEDDTVFRYDNGNEARTRTCWAVIMYNKEFESLHWDIRAY